MTPTPSSRDVPNSAEESLIDQAKADLAARLDISVQEIDVVEFRHVTWRDSSLGCPQPGRVYMQVLSDGSLIRLEAGGSVYEYHSGRGRGPFLCENPKPPAPDITPGGDADM